MKNTLQKDGTEIAAELRFQKMADFEPQNVAGQVPVLNELLQLRSKLSSLRSSLYGNDRLEELLQEVVQRTQAAGTDKTETAGKAPEDD